MQAEVQAAEVPPATTAKVRAEVQAAELPPAQDLVATQWRRLACCNRSLRQHRLATRMVFSRAILLIARQTRFQYVLLLVPEDPAELPPTELPPTELLLLLMVATELLLLMVATELLAKRIFGQLPAAEPLTEVFVLISTELLLLMVATELPPTELLVLMSAEFLVLLSKGTASANDACGLTRMCCRSHLLQAAQAAQATLAVQGCRKMDYACLLKFRSMASRRNTWLTCLPLGSSEAVGILSQRTGSPSGHRQDRAPQRALERNTRSRTTHK